MIYTVLDRNWAGGTLHSVFVIAFDIDWNCLHMTRHASIQKRKLIWFLAIPAELIAKQFHTQRANGPHWQKIMDVYVDKVLDKWTVSLWYLKRMQFKPEGSYSYGLSEQQYHSVLWFKLSRFDNSSILNASFSSRALGVLLITFMLKNGWVKANVRQKFLSHRACIFHSSFAMSSTLCFST